jgi:transcriptional regulator with XRE-family HTH domain
MNATIQFREAFARKIIKLRNEKDVTQEEFAKAIGITRSRYAAYEERRAEPGLPVLKKMAEFYGKTLDDLVNVG